MNSWPSDGWMQNIAMENNYSETAFLVKNEKEFYIRWFTPTKEIDLCGHATLAACYILWKEYHIQDNTIILNSNTGLLTVTKTDSALTLDFPIHVSQKLEKWDESVFLEIFGAKPIEIWDSEDQILVFETSKIVRTLSPNYELLKKQKTNRGWIAVATSDEPGYDYSFRFFAPNIGINEDSATGSAQCSLAYLWYKKFNQAVSDSCQLSQRGAVFYTEIFGDRVKISGNAKLYLVGEIDAE